MILLEIKVLLKVANKAFKMVCISLAGMLYDMPKQFLFILLCSAAARQ